MSGAEKKPTTTSHRLATMQLLKHLHGSVRERTRSNSTSRPEDRLKHVLRDVLQSARKDHVPK